MAHSIDHLIRETPKGVVIDLKRLFVYPDGHAHLTFKDDTNWPMNDPYEVMELLSGLMRTMQKKANTSQRRKRGSDS
jgi:hypothetical protein